MDAMRDRDWHRAAQRWALLRGTYSDLAPPWIQAAIALNRLGKHVEASSLLKEARDRFPDNPNSWIQSVATALEMDDLGAARQFDQTARKCFPEHIGTWLRAADLAIKAGDLEQAEAHNLEARQRFPEMPGGYAQQADMAMVREQWPLAVERWEAVIRRFPQHSLAYRRLHQARAHLAGTEPDEVSVDQEDDQIAIPSRRGGRAFLDLVWTKARLNLKSEASRNHLHYVWWIIDPLLYMSVFYLVFGILMERGGPGFIGYLLTGLVPFQWFAKTVQQTSNSIVAGKGLMNQVKISPLFFPLVGVLQNAGKQVFAFTMLAIFLVLYGLPPTIHWLAFIPVVIIQLLVMIVASCAIAMVVPFFRDLLNLVPTGIQFLLFASGIFYSVERIPEQWRDLFLTNPIANIIFQYRLIFIEQQWPDWSSLGMLALVSLMALGVVLVLYRRLEGVFPRVVLE
ncbi:ABC transporter permease [Alcanivorax sp. 521-1]|uniref:Transport permease protein n=1 Tax=Alloalcanivorax profundimaris TaxID=2735259 RepID=A0ABS0ARP1_9GAMM|nr:ABC transporter permease [Alloalcanivorax profundimaris]